MGRPRGNCRVSYAAQLIARIQQIASDSEQDPEVVLMHRSDVARLIGRPVGDLSALLEYAIRNGTLRVKTGRLYYGIGPGRKPPKPPATSRLPDVRQGNVLREIRRTVPAEACSIPKEAARAARSIFEWAR